MSGIIAIIAAFLAFVVPLAIPLFVQRWRTFFIVVAVAVAFFTWLTIDIGQGGENWIGSFLGGLMLAGFAGGAIAKLVALIGRRPEPPNLEH
jgi:hypothetical protein